MNRAKTLIFIAACLCCINIAAAQNFTTKGVEFWAAYGAHGSMYNADGSINTKGGSQKMVFYLLSNKQTTATVEIPAIGWKRTYNLSAGKTIETEEMPKVGSGDARLVQEGISNKGIHITSNDLITAYCHIYDDQSSATTLLIPVNISGQEYYTLGYSQQSLTPNGRSYCFVVATEDSTMIEVTPSGNTINHPAGVPFFQMLNKGEVLTLFGACTNRQDSIYHGVDLSGTYIRTLIQRDDDICKKIVVFSGSTATSVLCKQSLGVSSDNIFQQVPCIDNWGRFFIAVPTRNMETNMYRIMVVDPSQKVYANGRLLSNIINNRYYEFKSSNVTAIRSDSLVTVAQYITSAGQCGNNAAGDKNGDPEMIFLSPVGSGITSTIINSTKKNNIQSHFINVVMKANDVDSFKLDGLAMPQAFTVFDRNPTYAYAQIAVPPGRHVLQCDSGFNTYAYGYGKLESYGYNGGYSIKHINGYLGVCNPFKSVATTTTTCTATSFRLYFDVAEKLLSMYCNFNNNSHLTPNKELWLTDLKPDSSYVADSTKTTLYRYYLPGVYNYNTVEQMPLQITAYYPDKKGCIVKKLFSFLVDVIQKPVARISTQYDSCVNNALFMKDNSLSYGNSKLIQWQWQFSDGKSSTERNPQHQFDDYGEYNMQMRTINDVGCFADTVQHVAMYRRPVSSFVVSGINCSKQDLLFKSTASIQNDELTEWKWNFDDKTMGIAPNIIKQFTNSGDYQVKLITKSKHGCTDTATQLVRIYQTPEINLQPVLYAVAGDTLRISPVYTGTIKSYTWAPSTYLSNPFAPDPIALAHNDITYRVTATTADGSCKATTTTTLKMQQKLKIPSAFSPNGDGLNDTWRIFNIEGYPDCTVEIYNRWGNRIFYSKGYPAPWNGTFNGQPLPSGTYLYIVQARSGKNIIKETGSVTIIR